MDDPDLDTLGRVICLFMFNILILNIREIADPQSLGRHKLLSRIHKVDMLAILEPLVASPDDRILGKFKNFNFFANCSNKIWLFWRKHVTVDIITDDRQFVHTNFNMDMFSGFLNFAYVGTSNVARADLWHKLVVMGTSINQNLMVGGDFNMVMHEPEKLGGRRFDFTLTNNFNESMALVGISDLGFIGSKFTWKRGKLFERLDRCLVNQQWNTSYDFSQERGNVWYVLWKLHKRVATVLRSWNWDVFGDVDARVKKVEQRVSNLQALDDNTIDIIHKLEDANKELLEASLWEELLQQKARETHFTQGDRNTKYFHDCIKQRRANNIVMRIKNNEGHWITEMRKLGENVVSHFAKLFEFHETTDDIDVSLFEDVRHHMVHMDLCVIPTIEEIYSTLLEINYNKAPGPDGFTSAFYITC
ncbi:uncharacterized protein LOC110020084 [Phalaenopsis equestris]|uniref:uncharacterized protein LOC110020084 n=1 Tax=Phalaenopsis equestris TaxID=78828 RepID=UPI0009E4E836|nr:uncharacterized protein LOC110020084 [Phalaenopsis equestris]